MNAVDRIAEALAPFVPAVAYREVAARAAADALPLESIAYHAAQISTYIAVPDPTGEHLVSARYHANKITELANEQVSA